MEELIALLGEAAQSGRIVLDPPAAPGRLPAGLHGLARFAGGFRCSRDPDHEAVRWTGPAGSEYLQESPEIASMDLAHDECGNAWVLLLSPQGDPMQVLWACHDPSMLMAVAGSLPSFCEEWIAGREALAKRVDAQSCMPLARAITREAALASGDAVLREFAEDLDGEDWAIYDIRASAPARGFEREPGEPLRKHSRELLFAAVSRPRQADQRPWWRFWAQR